MKILCLLRICYKLIKRKFFLVPSFCKKCGKDVHDFIVPDDIWDEINRHIKYGHVLCYNCFCEKCGELGLPSVWQLELSEEEKLKIFQKNMEN